MKQILSFTLLLSFILGFSQIKFESGYYINSQGEKINGYIKNLDWNFNPTSMEFKASLESETEIKSLQDVKEFGIYGNAKFVRFEVEIDRSSDDVANLSQERNPELKKETVFLETLVEGKSSLYSYKENQFTRFFFQNEGDEVVGLINKRYFVTVNKIATNDQFKNQLRAKVNCNKTDAQITSLLYTRNTLTKYFRDYNNCRNVDMVDFTETETKSKINLYVKPGFNFASLDVWNSVINDSYLDFGSQTVLKLGIEMEYLLPFKKNKWGLFLGAYYKSFEAEAVNEVNGRESYLNYNSIEFPLGVRYYFHLTEKWKIYTHAAIIWDININSEFKFQNHSELLEPSSSNNYKIGIGYNFNSKFIAEFNYFTTRKVLNSYKAWDSHYESLGFSIGYNFL